ncbi:MAG: L7Ae/L30e/S12e/Gadd45 family ribosomal protein [Culicoidibacterales bacterium]
MSKQLDNLIGLMMRARKIDVGTAKIVEGIKKNKYHLVILATDASELTKEQFNKHARNSQTNIREYGTKDSLADAIGKGVTVAIGIKDKGFFQKVEEIMSNKNND